MSILCFFYILFIMAQKKASLIIISEAFFIVIGETVLLGTNLFNQAVGFAPAFHHVQHVADIYADAAGQLLVEEDIRRKAVPVAIKGQADELALAVEHRRT